MPLKKFGKSFKLGVTKEIMPYQLYTQDNIDQVYRPICGALPHLQDEDVEQFINNLDTWGCRGEAPNHNFFCYY